MTALGNHGFSYLNVDSVIEYTGVSDTTRTRNLSDI